MDKAFNSDNFAISPAGNGFSAFSTATGISNDYGYGIGFYWFVTAPYFTDGNFANAAYNYTVPETGIYSVKATLNYSTATITAPFTGYIPNIYIYKFDNNGGDSYSILSANFPCLDVNIPPVTLRTILSSGTINLAAVFPLNAGDQLTLLYLTDDTDLVMNFGSNTEPGNGNTWSVNQIA